MENFKIDIQVIPEIDEVIIQIICTIVAFLIIKKYFWEKIQAFLQKREQFISDNINNSIEQEKNAELKLEQAANTQKEANYRFQNIQIEAEKLAKEKEAKILDQANEEALKIKNKALELVEQEKIKVSKELNEQNVKIAAQLAEKILAKQITNDNELINSALEKI